MNIDAENNKDTDVKKIIFSLNLKAYMMTSKKTQQDLINDLNFKSATVSNWVNAQRYPREDKLEILANYFQISVSDLTNHDYLETKFKIKDVDNYPPDVIQEVRVCNMFYDEIMSLLAHQFTEPLDHHLYKNMLEVFSSLLNDFTNTLNALNKTKQVWETQNKDYYEFYSKFANPKDVPKYFFDQRMGNYFRRSTNQLSDENIWYNSFISKITKDN